MTTKYVRTTGSDAADGSTGTPWLTISKALATVVAGDVVNVGTGSYVENTGAGGTLSVTQNFASVVTLQSETGLVDVTVTGASDATNNTMIQSGANNITFSKFIFTSRVATNQQAVRLAQCSNIIFNDCTFTTVSDTSLRYGCAIQPTGVTTVGPVAFNRCTFNQSGVNAAYGCWSNWSAGQTITGITFTDCLGTTVQDALFLRGGTFTVTRGKFTTTSGHAVTFGEDAATSAMTTTGTLTGALCTCTSGHALIFGAGCVSDSVTNCRLEGGDYAVVIKEHTGGVYMNNYIVTGTTAAVFFKASNGAVVKFNRILSNQANTAACKVGKGDTANTCSNVVFSDNYVIVDGSPTATIFLWGDVTNDTGGGVCDRNQYDLRRSGAQKSFGNVRAAIGIADMTQLCNAWAGYGVINDTRSMLLGGGLSVHRTAPGRELGFV